MSFTKTQNKFSRGIDDKSDGTAVTIDADSNVGIGTTPNATSKLSVLGNASSYGIVAEQPSGYSALGIKSTTVNQAWSFIAQDNGSNSDLLLYGGSSAGVKMTVGHTGNIGIGTTNPGFQLENYGTTNASSGWNAGGVVTGFAQANTSNGDFRVGTTTSHDLAFYTSATERMRITAAGTTQVTGGFEAAQPGAGTNAFAAGLNAGLTGQAAGAIAVGTSAGETSQSQFGVAVGNAAGYTSQGASAIAVGNSSGQTSQGDNAVAVGINAGYTSQGANSVAVGPSSGYASQGDNTVAVGNSAGNTSQGANAVAVGLFAGTATQGANSVAVGYVAGQTTQGDNAVAAGYAAGQGSQGANSIAVGSLAGQTGQGANSIAIGNRAGQSNQAANGIIINSTGLSNNSTDPNHIILVSGGGKFLRYNGTDTWDFAGGDVKVPNNNLVVGKTSSSATTTGAELKSNGQINAASTGDFLNMYSTSASAYRFYVTNAGTINASSTSIQAISDASLKENVRDLDKGLDTILALKPRRFDWKNGDGVDIMGFIAQEVDEILPELVADYQYSDTEVKKSLKMGDMVPSLVKAIQEQQAMIETLQAEVSALKGA